MTEFKTMFGNRVYIVALFSIIGLFAYLSTIPGITILCEDKVCNELHCEVYCNVKNSNSRSIYIYNHDGMNIQFDPEVESFDTYIKYYGKWRYTNFTMETRLGNIPSSAKYVMVFPAYSTKEFKLIIRMQDANRINYEFGVKK